MKTVYALAAAGLLACAAPAFAQNAGAPGAVGAGPGLSGSNTGAGPATMNNEPGGGHPAASGSDMGASGSDLGEGRAAAPETNTPGGKSNNAPDTVRGGQNGQEMSK